MQFRKEAGIEGKVARVDYNSVVVNRGSEHGVEPNLVFNIMRDITVDDPDTGEFLGSVRYATGIQLTTRTVYPLFSVLGGPYHSAHWEHIKVGSVVVSAGYWESEADEEQPEVAKPAGIFERIRGLFQ